MTDLSRKEHAGVTFPQATWTSFDRYGRYGAIVGALRATLGAGRRLVLDVGDTAGHLHLFDPELDVVGLDIELAEKPIRDTVAVQGDGARLPFPDDSFDAVVSSDVLEHVPPEARPPFLAELRRVSRDLVVVAAPFDTAGVAGVEEVVRRYALLAEGQPQAQLEEHRENGLPDLPATLAALGADGWQVDHGGNGNLWDWLLMMVLRFQLEARPALRPLSEGYDAFYNRSLADRAAVGPYYRYVVAARAGAAPALGPTPSAIGTDPSDVSASALPPGELAALMGALIAADSTEAARQDTVPGIDRLQADVDELRGRMIQLGERVEVLLDQQAKVVEQLRGFRDRLRRLTHPMRKPPT